MLRHICAQASANTFTARPSFPSIAPSIHHGHIHTCIQTRTGELRPVHACTRAGTTVALPPARGAVPTRTASVYAKGPPSRTQPPGSIGRARARACRGYCEYRRDTRWPTRMYPVGMGRAVRVADPHRSSSGAAWSAIVQHLTLHQQHHDSCAPCECASTQEQRGAKDRRCSNCVAFRHSSCNGGARCFRGVSTHCW
jgi:hypothetical protein